MSECEKIQELISAMLDGELGDEESIAVREHIAVCSECAEMYDVFAKMSADLSGDMEEIPDGLHEKIMKGVAREKSSAGRKKIYRIARYSSIGAAACLVLVCLSVLMPSFNFRAGSAAPKSCDGISMDAAGAAAKPQFALTEEARDENYSYAGIDSDNGCTESVKGEECMPAESDAEEPGNAPEPMPEPTMAASVTDEYKYRVSAAGPDEEEIIGLPEDFIESLGMAETEADGTAAVGSSPDYTVTCEAPDGSAEYYNIFLVSDAVLIATPGGELYRAAVSAGEFLELIK